MPKSKYPEVHKEAMAWLKKFQAYFSDHTMQCTIKIDPDAIDKKYKARGRPATAMAETNLAKRKTVIYLRPDDKELAGSVLHEFLHAICRYGDIHTYECTTHEEMFVTGLERLFLHMKMLIEKEREVSCLVQSKPSNG